MSVATGSPIGSALISWCGNRNRSPIANSRYSFLNREWKRSALHLADNSAAKLQEQNRSKTHSALVQYFSRGSAQLAREFSMYLKAEGRFDVTQFHSHRRRGIARDR